LRVTKDFTSLLILFMMRDIAIKVNVCFQESCVQGRCVDVKHMMNTWTLQMGYPIVDIRYSRDDTYIITQERFLYYTGANITSKYKSPYG